MLVTDKLSQQGNMQTAISRLLVFVAFLMTLGCSDTPGSKEAVVVNTDSLLVYENYKPEEEALIISRAQYQEQLYGFWLAQCIANWTGLVTEMDKIGNVGEIKTGAFYTRDDWGKPDDPSIFSEGQISPWSETIDFVFRDPGEVWGADDDTDIEYIYQHLLYTNQTSVLTGEQIAAGWLKHILPEEENYLWVSNQAAYDLMKTGVVPPATSDPARNPHFAMIDAQLTTEIFGLFAPARPDIALQMAQLPIQTTARQEAEWIAEFYVIMHALASVPAGEKTMKERLEWMSDQARQHLPEGSYPALMYDFVRSAYTTGWSWEQTRDSVYVRYQVEQQDGYNITAQNIYCNGCFAAGINFAASLVSLFYGEGDLMETIKIGTLAGWDSDNPTATWGGLIGFMLGKEGVEAAFGRTFANSFNIHRTRQGFANQGIDTFDQMAWTGVYVVDRVVQSLMQGGVYLPKDSWYIPEAAQW